MQVKALLALQNSLFTTHLMDPSDGLFHHGADALAKIPSCCKWGRANGWTMMSHVEVLSALDPSSEEFRTALHVFQAHAAAVAKVQAQDGRWHQLLNDTSTWLETSGTAMFTHAIAVGVGRGWLPRASYAPVLANAWAGLKKVISSDGKVAQICGGFGIPSTDSPEDYVKANPATSADPMHHQDGGYWNSSPGLGAVLRAIVSLSRYVAA